MLHSTETCFSPNTWTECERNTSSLGVNTEGTVVPKETNVRVAVTLQAVSVKLEREVILKRKQMGEDNWFQTASEEEAVKGVSLPLRGAK